jgi:hypothetical protein
MAAATQALSQRLMAGPGNTSRPAILAQEQCRWPNSRCMLALHGTHKHLPAPRSVLSFSLQPLRRGCRVRARDNRRGQLRRGEATGDARDIVGSIEVQVERDRRCISQWLRISPGIMVRWARSERGLVCSLHGRILRRYTNIRIPVGRPLATKPPASKRPARTIARCPLGYSCSASSMIPTSAADMGISMTTCRIKSAQAPN